MTAVRVITTPSLEGKRRAFVLAEDRIGHYPEFRTFFAKIFDLGQVGLGEPGYLAAPSGTEYALVFIGRSGEPFPAGVEIHALVPALEPLDEELVDLDLWEILRWMISGVGGAWTLADLNATGRLYRIPAEIGADTVPPRTAGTRPAPGRARRAARDRFRNRRAVKRMVANVLSDRVASPSIACGKFWLPFRFTQTQYAR